MKMTHIVNLGQERRSVRNRLKIRNFDAIIFLWRMTVETLGNSLKAKWKETGERSEICPKKIRNFSATFFTWGMAAKTVGFSSKSGHFLTPCVSTVTADRPPTPLKSNGKSLSPPEVLNPHPSTPACPAPPATDRRSAFPPKHRAVPPKNEQGRALETQLIWHLECPPKKIS